MAVKICGPQDSWRALTRFHDGPFVPQCAPFPVPPLASSATRRFPICIRSRITAKTERLVTSVLTVLSEVCMMHFLNIQFRPVNHVTLSVHVPSGFSWWA